VIIRAAAGLLILGGCGGASAGYAGAAFPRTDAALERGPAEAAVGDGGFVAVPPCLEAGDYVSGATTVAFGGTLGYAYAPRCLAVPVGTTVTFVGDFSPHPLTPSALRGSRPGSPITDVSAGSSASFTFPAPGFYAYFCAFHGTLDDGTGMAGVVRVYE
jgi:plastocyanin